MFGEYDVFWLLFGFPRYHIRIVFLSVCQAGKGQNVATCLEIPCLPLYPGSYESLKPIPITLHRIASHHEQCLTTRWVLSRKAHEWADEDASVTVLHATPRSSSGEPFLNAAYLPVT